MNRSFLTAASLAALATASAAESPTPGSAGGPSANSAKPNIVYMLCDDLGYGDVHCLNPQRGKIATPNMDRLATQGMTFTDAHSGSSVCTPTRYGILTGRYAWRTRLQGGVMQDNSPSLIAPDRLTVAGLLKERGYHTAILGKWHLGYLYEGMEKVSSRSMRGTSWPPVGTRFLGGPVTHGFEYFYGFHHAASMQSLAENDRVIAKIAPIEMLPRLTKRAVAYIDERAQAKQPFFLYLPWNSPHTPIVPTKEWQGKSGLGKYGDYVMQTDWSIGQVLDALDKAGLAGNTLVMLASDNGCSPQANVKSLEKHGHFPSAQFRGYKTDLWDGGHRIPFLVRWPGVVTPGTKSDQLVCLGDLMATTAEIVGAKLPAHAGEDSFSFLPALTRKGACAREAVVHHSVSGMFAIRQGQWKLVLSTGGGGWTKGKIKDAPGQLYDLSNDISERTNQYTKQPEIVARLTKLLEQYVAEGRSTPLRQAQGEAGPKQKNDVPVDIFKKGE